MLFMINMVMIRFWILFSEAFFDCHIKKIAYTREKNKKQRLLGWQARAKIYAASACFFPACCSFGRYYRGLVE